MSTTSQRAKSGKGRAATARNADDTKQRILDVAIQLFRERGYEGTSLEELAGRVGITAAGLYYHYANKAEILFVALESAQKELAIITAPSEDAVTPPEQLADFTRKHLLSQISRADFAELYSFGPAQLSNPLNAKQRRRLRAMERAHLDRLERILKAGRDEGSFSVDQVALVAFAIIGMCEFVIQWFKPEGELTKEQIADVYAELALRMVGAS